MLLLAFLGAVCAMCAFGSDKRVFDLDNLLTPEQESALEEIHTSASFCKKMRSFRKRTHLFYRNLPQT